MVGLPKIERQTAQYKHVGLEDFCLLFHWPEEIDALAVKGILFLLTCTNQRQKLWEIAIHTLLQTNIAPENGWFEDDFPFGMAYFQGANVSLRECHILAKKKNFPGIREVFWGENIITQNDESVPYSAKVVGLDFFGGWHLWTSNDHLKLPRKFPMEPLSQYLDFRTTYPPRN